MKPRLVILGGSSPFTAALIDALLDQTSALPAHEVRLYGRNRGYLNLVATYGQNRLGPFGWDFRVFLDLEKVLDGAVIVLHQIRYGGLESRALGERFCEKYGVPADETLGPAAILSGLFSTKNLREMCRVLNHICPHAWVLNLTNPLSALTYLMTDWGIKRCLGICELPLQTVREAAALLGLDTAHVKWHYYGLNHRGFIFGLRSGHRDLMDELLSHHRNALIGGLPIRSFALLDAIPLKYFSLVQTPCAKTPRRADFLERLRRSIAQEIRCHPDRSPPSLQQRYLAWYPLSVAPLLTALYSGKSSRHVVTIARAGLPPALETQALVCQKGVLPLTHPSPPVGVLPWLKKFIRGELAFIRALADPSPDTIYQAVAADLLCPASLSATIASDLWGIAREVLGGSRERV